MKARTIALVISWVVLGTVAIDAQRQTALPTIEFAKLSGYVNDYAKRRNGQRLIVSDVPVVEGVAYEKAYRMYSFAPEEGDAKQTFFTSAVIAKALRQNLNSRAVLMTISCVLIEIQSSHDVYRSPFATKIEGVNMDGDIVWTVTGPPPAKLKIVE